MNFFTLDVSGNRQLVVNYLDTATWIERYLEGGEFEFTGTNVDYLLETLPIDTLVSHSETFEVMIVEEYTVEEGLEEGPTVIITGRSLTTVMMENRVVTENSPDHSYGFAYPGRGYSRRVHSGWYNAKKLLENYLKTSIEDPLDDMTNFDVRSLYTDDDVDYVYHRWEDMPTLGEAVKEVLAPKNLGLRSERPNEDHDTLDFVIYQGEIRTYENMPGYVEFSWYMGDIRNARYLMSSKTKKNAIFVYDSMFTRRYYVGSESGIGRRVTKHDASSIDWGEDPLDPGATWTDPPASPLSSAPTGAEIATNAPLFDALAAATLAKQTTTKIIDAEIMPDSRHIYKTDYDLGDVIMVAGKYDIIQPMRVVEYAITVEDSMVSGMPTLAEPYFVPEP